MNQPSLAPQQLKRALQCAVACDALLTSDPLLRTFTWEKNWIDGVDLAMYYSGGGDSAMVFFPASGQVLIKGFDHESEVSPHARDVYAVWPRMYDDVPAALMACLADERAEQDEVTFVYWSEDGVQWCQGRADIPEDMDDGSDWLLDMLQMDADDFIDWGRDYFGAKFDDVGADAVRRVFSQQA
jgi:hypothetical protein